MSVQPYVRLRGGLTVPTEPLALLLSLERREVYIRAGYGGQLVVPRGACTPDELAALRRWRWHVLALLQYEVPPQDTAARSDIACSG